jgi:hypothetical protein
MHQGIRKILALPYLPMHEVEDYFVILITQMANDPELNKFTRIADFADYMTNQWIDNDSMPYCIWNVIKQKNNSLQIKKLNQQSFR